MAKHRSHRRRRHSRTHSRRHQRGGALDGNPPSAWGWGLGTLGNGWTQFMNSLSLQPGQNLGASQSNAIVPVGNPNAQTATGNIGPNMTGDIPKGGARRRRRTCKRGGNLAPVIAQAAVPGALLILNQTAKRRHRRHK